MKRPPLESDFFRDMVLFSEVARQRSFSQAATSLKVSLSLLSRRIAAHERRLGVQLLRRTTRRVELTETGARYYDGCQRLIDEAKDLHEQLYEMAGALRGRLHVRMSRDASDLLVAPLLPKFTALYPELELELDVSPRPVDSLSGNIDLAICIGEQPDSSLRVRPLKSLDCHLYAAPSYLQRHGTPRHPSALAEHDCVRIWGLQKDSTWTLRAGAETCDVAVQGRLALNSIEVATRLVSQGMGIGLIADCFAHEHLRSGRLVQILKTWSGAALPVVAVLPTRLVSAKVQALVDFLKSQLATLAH